MRCGRAMPVYHPPCFGEQVTFEAAEACPSSWTALLMKGEPPHDAKQERTVRQCAAGTMIMPT